MKRFFLVLVLFFSAFSLFSQSQKAQDLLEEGFQYFSLGKYNLAISKYEEAIQVDPQFSGAYYELAYTYYAIKEYDKAISYAKKVIKMKKGNESLSIVLIGNIYDIQGKYSKAIKTYHSGIKTYPNDHMLYFNLGVTYYNHKDYKNAQTNFIESIKINPRHASSHVYLGWSLDAQNQSFKAILPITYALMLEPNSKRSVTWLKWLKKELNYKVEKQNNTINISLDVNALNDEFGSAKTMYTLDIAYFLGEDSITRTECEIFIIAIEKYIKSLNIVTLDNTDFYKNIYVAPFEELVSKKLITPFGYHILQSTKEEEVKKWIMNNEETISTFDNWFNNLNDEHTNFKK
jgi:tetratricopeptide (TPR) repeat protein